MKTTFFSRYALYTLMIVFFVVPFSLRGARLAIQGMGNDVKEWLPEEFSETKDLEWFRDNFLGEQFVVATWKGCTGLKDDQTLKTFIGKLAPEIPPSQRDETYRDVSNDEFFNEDLGLYVRQIGADALERRGKCIGDDLRLYTIGDYTKYDNWGGLDEKWLQGTGDLWYYITPDGKLYQWSGNPNLLGAMVRGTVRLTRGSNSARGELISDLGPKDGPWYYADTRRLAAPLFKTVTTGPGVLDQLTRDGGPLDGGTDEEEEARRRVQGTLFGPGGEQTCVILTLTEAAREDLHRVLGRGALGKPRGRLPELATEIGLAAEELKLGGPPVDNVAIDEEGAITLYRLIGWSVALGLGIAMACFRSWKLTVMVFFVGGVSAITSLSIIWWCGSKVDAVVLSMPPLVYVLGLSGAVHIINYYRDEVNKHGLIDAPGRAIAHGWKPCTLAALTTGIGLMSLTVSEIIPIQKFGTFSAIGVMATLVLLFAYLPAALELWPPKPPVKTGSNGKSRFAAFFDRAVERVASLIVKHNIAVAGTCTVVLVLFALGLPRINTSIQLLKLFDGDAKIIRDYAWLEENLGQLIPMELVIKVDTDWIQPVATAQDEEDEQDPDETADAPAAQGDAHAGVDPRLPLDFLQRMEMAARIQRVVEEEFGENGRNIVGRAMGAPTFANELPGPKDSYRGGFARSLYRHREELVDTDYLRDEKVFRGGKPAEDVAPGRVPELWRVSLRLGALNDVDYGEFVDELKQAVEPVMAAYRYRNENILPTTFAQHGHEDGAPRVILLGATAGSDAAGKDDVKAADKTDRTSPQIVRQHKIDQTRLFSETLYDLLLTSRLKVVKSDVKTNPFPEGYATSDAWGAALASADCVVLIQDQPDYDVEFIKKHTEGKFVDARDHVFDAAAGSLTARQRFDADQTLTGMSAIYTGVVPVVYKAQRALLQSLIKSIGWAFVFICLVMMIVLRSPRAGIVSMLPNIFPVVLIFGAMGWSNIMVDIGSMMTASVAMGVAVDDTIHFLTWFRRGIDEGKDRKEAIVAAYRRVSVAMFQTTLIGGLGLSVFALSTFTPTQRFGVLMLTLLSTALIGDLVFLPAILAGPLGRVFSGKGKEKKDKPAAEETSPTAEPALVSAASGERLETPHSTAKPDPGDAHGVYRSDQPHRSRD